MPVDHHALAILERSLADEGAHRRLVIDRAELDHPEGAVELEAGHCNENLGRLGRSSLGKRRCGRVRRAVADDRAEAGIVVEAFLIGLAELEVLGRVHEGVAEAVGRPCDL